MYLTVCIAGLCVVFADIAAAGSGGYHIPHQCIADPLQVVYEMLSRCCSAAEQYMSAVGTGVWARRTWSTLQLVN